MSSQRGFAPILIVLLITVAIGGYLVYSGKINPNLKPVTKSTSNQSLDLKTFDGSTYSFKYPANFVYGFTMYKTDNSFDQNGPVFFNSQKDLDESLNCISKKLGTLSNPCKSGLFSVVDVTDYPTAAKQDMQYYLNTKDPNDIKAILYKDTQNRQWIILEPVYGLGGTQANAEVTINGKTHQLQISILDSFIKSDPSVKDGVAQLEYIKKMLSTVEFKENSQSEIMKTYTNSKYNYTVKYPDDWRVDNKSADNITTFVGGEFRHELDNKPPLVSISVFETTKFKLEDSIKDLSLFDYKTLEKNGHTFLFTASTYTIGAPASKETEQKAKEVLETVFSSFKFTN